jgi:hypothetical protein
VPSQRGWLTPNSGAVEFICRPVLIPRDDTLAFLAAVNGALLDLTKEWNWEEFGDLTPAEAAAAMLEMYTTYTLEGCCEVGCFLPGTDTPIFRIGVGGHIEQLSNGAWVTPFGDYELPPVEARTDPTPEERICLAAANAANVLEQTYETMIDAYNTDIDPFFGVTTMATSLAGTIAVALGLVTAGLALVVIGVFEVFYQTFQYLTDDVWDADFLEAVKCALVTAATDDAGIVTFDYDTFMNTLSEQVDLLGGDVELKRFGQVWYMMQFLGEDGLNLAGNTTAITSADCTHCDETCYLLRFTITDGGLTNFGVNTGVWTNAIGWQGQVFSSQNTRYLEVGKTFADVYVHTVTFGWDKPTGSGANNSTLIRLKLNGSTVQQFTTNLAGTDLSHTFTVDGLIDEIYVAMNNGTSGQPITLESVEFVGHDVAAIGGGEEC